MFDGVWQDLRHAARSLRRTPGFTATAVLTLALGLGATSAVVSVYDTVVLKALPYADPDRLYTINEIVGARGATRPPSPVNALHFQEWQRSARTFQDIALVAPSDYTLTGSGDPVRLDSARVSAGILRTFGVEPALGRGFTPEEDVAGQDDVVILSHGLWSTRFGADPGIVGRAISIDHRPHVVVGVLPSSFNLPTLTQLYNLDMGLDSGSVQLLKPFAATPRDLRPLGSFNHVAIGRLKPGISARQAADDLNLVQAELARRAPEPASFGAVLTPMAEQLVSRTRAGLQLVLGTVAAVLLVACVNITNLLLVRANRRKRELAIRRAAGARQAQIVRHALTESVLLATVSGALGLLVGLGLVELLRLYAPIELPRLDEVTLDSRMVAITSAITVTTGLLIGILPALRSAATAPADVLRVSSSTTDGTAGARLRSTLVGVQVAACAVCLAVGALLATSFMRLMAVDPGFARTGVVTLDLFLPPERYETTERALQFVRALTDEARALPGVAAAGVTDQLPLAGPSNSAIMIEGSTLPRQARPSATIRSTDGAYFDAIGIRMIDGRRLTDSDSGRRLAVVSSTAAGRLWPGQAALGRRFRFGEDDSPYFEVVGVAADARGLGLNADPPAYIFVPVSENYYSRVALAVRTTVDPAATGAALAGIVRTLDSQLPVPTFRTMTSIVDDSLARRRFQADLVTILAIVTLLLAGIGIYGVVSQAVAQRMSEFGIRMALGAERRHIRAAVLRRGLAPVAIGLAAGLGVAAGVGRLLRGLLYEVSPTEPGPLAVVCAVLLGVAAVASLIPARRASRIDPMLALRTE